MRECNKNLTNMSNILRQPTPKLKEKRDDNAQGEEQSREDMKNAEEESLVGGWEEKTWVLGATSEENEKYRIFLKYCEDMREEARLIREGDKERKREAGETLGAAEIGNSVPKRE